MKRGVLDASVVAKWFVRDDEPDLDAADQLRERVLLSPDAFVVPTLFAYELLATLSRRLRSADDVQRCLDAWLALGTPAIDMDGTLLHRAATLVQEHRVTGYDAAYLAVAEHIGGVWLTCDRPAWRRVADTGLAQLVADDRP